MRYGKRVMSVMLSLALLGTSVSLTGCGSSSKKAENGEYQGTKEEINAQMQSEFLNRSYELLETAYQNMQYGETETIVFKVKSNDKNVFSMKEDEISSFITKILRLDEIQG